MTDPKTLVAQAEAPEESLKQADWQELEQRAFSATTADELESVYNNIPENSPHKFAFYNAFSDRRFFLPKA